YNCNIIGLDAHGMDFLANSFNKSNYDEIRGPDTGTVFYNCNLKHIKINDGLREDGSDRSMFNPKEYFSDYIERRSRNLKLDDKFSKCVESIKKGTDSSFSKKN
ncbi:type III effector, partial [Escherichia coli]|nr:type III effector [Escherichia coli]